MTQQNDLPEDDMIEDDGKKSRIVRMVLIGIGVALIAGLSAGVTWFLTKSSAPSEEAIAAAAEQMVASGQVGDGGDMSGEGASGSGIALYFAIEPEFVVNYKGSGRQRFLLTEISVLSRDQLTIDAVSQHLPLIRNNLIQLLGKQSYEVLRTDKGREQLAQDMTENIQKTLVELIGKPGIERVLFRSFVIQ